MDRTSAQDALAAAQAASAAARRRGRSGAAVYVTLGLVEMLLLGLLGPRGGSFVVILLLALFPLAAGIVYSASRAATPRHSRALNAALLGLAAAVVSVTLTVGRAVFPDSYGWWIGGAVVGGLAIGLCGVLELRARGGSPR